MIKVLLLFSLVLWVSGNASAVDYYISPEGAGVACTESMPCRWDAAISRAMPGDSVVLLDGVYGSAQGVPFVTERSGLKDEYIWIRGKNRGGAVLEWPFPGSVRRFGQILDIQHSYVRVSGLQVNGLKASWDAVRIFGGGSHGGLPAVGVILEKLSVHDTGGSCFGIFNAREGVIKGSTCDRGGFQGPGEGFYISSNGSPSRVIDFEIFGNLMIGGTDNLVDFKFGAKNVDVHHNIFRGWLLKGVRRPGSGDGSDDGLVRSASRSSILDNGGNLFRDNVVENSASTWVVLLEGNRVDVRGNVFKDISAGSFVEERTSPASIMIVDNVLCGVESVRLDADIVFERNVIDDTDVACNLREGEINREMAELLDEGLEEEPKLNCSSNVIKDEDMEFVVTVSCKVE